MQSTQVRPHDRRATAGFGWCSAAVLLIVVLVTGCAHRRLDQLPLTSALHDMHLIYLRSEPYRSLYVELDAVEGTGFSDADVDRFRAFLGQWCDKPDGITVARSSVIPRSVARGHSADWLARQHIDGPPEDGRVGPAYLYVLVYDNRINRPPVQSPAGASLWPLKESLSPRLGRAESPHVNVAPYPAMIYADRSWLGGLLPGRYWRDILFHETGHTWGLVSRESRTGGPHCATKGCTMGGMSDKVQSDIARWLKRQEPPPDFCDACAAELRESRHSTRPAPHTRFVGPVLVRETAGYRVISLPGFCGLFIGDPADAEISRFRAESRSLGDDQGTWWAAHADTDLSRDSILQAISEARKDLDPNVRWAAAELEKRIGKGALLPGEH